MEREEQLKYCRACLNKTIDSQYGVICGLTHQLPEFKDNCADFRPVGGEIIPKVEEKQRSESTTKEPFKKVFIIGAPKELRFINYLIDSILISIIFTTYIMSTNSNVEEMLLNGTLPMWPMYLIQFSYYFLFEVLLRKTPGKMLTKTVVVMDDGSEPNITSILIRSFVRFIPLEFISFLFYKDMGWHDMFARTKVVKE